MKVRGITEWEPSADLLALVAHVGWGAAVILGGVVLHQGWMSLSWLVAWVVLKDFVFDLAVERDTILGSTIDATYYAIGAALALAVLWIGSLL